MRLEYGITASYKMVDLRGRIRGRDSLLLFGVWLVRMRRYRLPEGRRSWFWAPARSVSDRASSLTSAPCTVPGHLPRKGMRRSSSIITRRRSAPTLISRIKAYFEPAYAGRCGKHRRLGQPDGAVVQFGGQTAIKGTEALMKMGVPNSWDIRRECRRGGRPGTVRRILDSARFKA